MRTGRRLLIVFLLLVLVTICVVMGLQLFRVREVVVEGCSQRDPLLVAELAQVAEDNNTAAQLAIAELAETLLGGETSV